MAADGSMSVAIGKQEGSSKPWWTQYRVEVVGWTPKEGKGSIDGNRSALTREGGNWSFTIAAKPDGAEIDLR